MAAVDEPAHLPEPDPTLPAPKGRHGELKSDEMIHALYSDRPAVAALIIAVRTPIISTHGWNGTFQRHAKLLKRQMPEQYGTWKSRDLAKKCTAAFTSRLGPPPWMIADVLKLYVKDDKERANLQKYYASLAEQAAQQARRPVRPVDRTAGSAANKVAAPNRAAGRPASAVRAPMVTKVVLSEQLTEANRRVAELLEQQIADRTTILLLRSKLAVTHRRGRQLAPAAARRRAFRRTPQRSLILAAPGVPRQADRDAAPARASGPTRPDLGWAGTVMHDPASMGLKSNELLRSSSDPVEDPLPFSRSSGANRAMLVLAIMIVTVMILWVTIEQVF